MTKFKTYLIWECFLLFWALPLALAILKPRGWIYITLWVFTLSCYFWMQRNGYNFKADWNRKALNKITSRRIILPLIPITVALAIFTYIMIPQRLFSLPLERTQLWVMVMILYPLLSVIPQEIIFRSFFFKRYAAIFSNPKIMILMSALAFGWVHIVLLNWVAVVFSFFGGIIFANTYSRTRSLSAACLEHALYGCTLFTLGLGYYFYHGHTVN